MSGGEQTSTEEEIRREQILRGWRAVRARIAAACADAGRDPAEVTLVAVSKTFPATDIRVAVALGINDLGENRDQEARVKAAELADLDVRWHFVGRLQRNKAASVARYAAVVHSLDRPDLIDALARGADRAGRQVRALVQVSLDPVDLGAGTGRPGRGGAAPADVPALADRIAAAASLRFGGVMAVAPLGADPVAAFAVLADVSARLRASHPSAATISAGMSADLEAAIACGATLVRVGTAVFGSRPPMLLG